MSWYLIYFIIGLWLIWQKPIYRLAIINAPASTTVFILNPVNSDFKTVLHFISNLETAKDIQKFINGKIKTHIDLMHQKSEFLNCYYNQPCFFVLIQLGIVINIFLSVCVILVIDINLAHKVLNVIITGNDWRMRSELLTSAEECAGMVYLINCHSLSDVNICDDININDPIIRVISSC